MFLYCGDTRTSTYIRDCKVYIHADKYIHVLQSLLNTYQLFLILELVYTCPILIISKQVLQLILVLDPVTGNLSLVGRILVALSSGRGRSISSPWERVSTPVRKGRQLLIIIHNDLHVHAIFSALLLFLKIMIQIFKTIPKFW